MAVKELSELFVQPVDGVSLRHPAPGTPVFTESDVWAHSLSIPFYCAVISSLSFVLHVFFTGGPVKILLRHWTGSNNQELIPKSRLVAPPSYASSVSAEIKERAKTHGGPIIFIWKLLRLLGRVLLLSLSVYTAVLEEGSGNFGSYSRGRLRDRPTISPRELQDLGLCLASVLTVCCILSLVAVGNNRRWSVIASRHLDLLPLSFFGVYAYRNVFPFATFTWSPADEEEGWVLWGKVSILFLIALVYPLCVPRQCVPFDPEASMEHPCPEQTASLLSLVTYSFLDQVILLGNRLPHLRSDLFPPIADYDSSRSLRKRAFPVLENFMDPKKRHLFFGLLRVFKAEYILLSLMIVIQVLAGFASPFGIKQLLKHIETDGANATIKPWVWIAWLFLGPTINSISYQWYMYVATRVLVRVECILIELVFEYSLKVRVKTEARGPEKQNGNVAGSTNLVGIINNLVTTNLANIADGRDFLYLILFVPLQITLCVVFLYSILGWSAFVGMAVMLVSFPLPGYIAKRTRCMQVKRMRTTGARIDAVSEIMNVLRMVKMFGWETKMYERVAEKRDQELVYVLFSSITVFDMLKDQLHIVFFVLNQVIAGRVSLDRLDNFVKTAELLDEFTSNAETPGMRVPKDTKINLIIGPTGSGKASLLMALLGEMHYTSLTTESWFNLPRSAGVAYAAQESWIQNETIRENILFGSPFDEERYTQRAKGSDYIGQGDILSTQIVLLDDVLAALDVHTSKWVVDKCFTGDLVKNRTVILVTHNVALAKPIADYVVSMGSDGRVLSHGSVLDAVELDATLALEIESEEEKLRSASEQVDTPEEVSKSADGKLIVAEEIEEEHISWSAVKMSLSGMGGRHPVLFFIVCIASLALCEVGIALQTWFLGYWASKYLDHSAEEVPVLHYVGVYVLCCAVSLSVYILSYIVYIRGAIRASRTLHNDFIRSILGTTMRWLDTTPIVSRVLTRCTQDIRAIDGPVSVGLFYFGEFTFTMLARFFSVILFTPIFMVPGLLVAVFGGLCAQFYIKAQLSVKREMSATKAPVLGHLGAPISGLVSLRAYGAQGAFIQESMKRIDRYTRAASTFYNLNRWVCVRVDALGGLFAAGLATYPLYFGSHGESNTGFSLNMAVGFSGMILWYIQRLNELEVQGNSLERVEKYTTIEHEPKSTDHGTPPAYWPSSGKLEVERLSARYSPGGPEALCDINFNVGPGERIGIVGRTGSGKSSLTLALLRCIFTEGKALYDGVDTSKINLDSLRSNITIIPQVPELLSGSPRQNLDPFNQYDDASLNSALQSSGLFSLRKDSEDGGRLTLDSAISTGGSNISVGQRQILGSKLLILDEATSAIDHNTDAAIQSSLRHELSPDVTVMTVAHRLHTIMDADKIMVLDAGRIVEFDKPSVLLKNPSGKLRALVDESGDKEHLFGMASFRQ